MKKFTLEITGKVWPKRRWKFRNAAFLPEGSARNPGVAFSSKRVALNIYGRYIINSLGFPAPGNDSNEVAPVEQLCLAYAPHLTSKQYLVIIQC
jgi:hypothetical protein